MFSTRFLTSLLALLLAPVVKAEPVRVRHQQGEVHAFLALRDDNGKLLGMADEVNTRVGRVWQSRLTIHFLDGSVDDETSTYTQASTLHLLTDHHTQHGPSFPTASDVAIDTATGRVTYHVLSDGKDVATTEHMDLPPDLANGFMPMVLQNYPRGATEIKVSYLVNAPKPRLVKFEIYPDGTSDYHVEGATRHAARYRLHVNIGGLEGLVAPLLGKQPPDLAAWVSAGDAPTFLRLHGFLYLGGPMWQLQLASPQW